MRRNVSRSIVTFLSLVALALSGCSGGGGGSTTTSPPPVTCAATGTSCATSACCTATDVCASNICSPPAACAGTGASCATAADCCNGAATCVGAPKVCTLPAACSGTGAACALDSDCCNAADSCTAPRLHRPRGLREHRRRLLAHDPVLQRRGLLLRAPLRRSRSVRRDHGELLALEAVLQLHRQLHERHLHAARDLRRRQRRVPHRRRLLHRARLPGVGQGEDVSDAGLLARDRGLLAPDGLLRGRGPGLRREHLRRDRDLQRRRRELPHERGLLHERVRERRLHRPREQLQRSLDLLHGSGDCCSGLCDTSSGSGVCASPTTVCRVRGRELRRTAPTAAPRCAPARSGARPAPPAPSARPRAARARRPASAARSPARPASAAAPPASSSTRGARPARTAAPACARRTTAPRSPAATAARRSETLHGRGRLLLEELRVELGRRRRHARHLPRLVHLPRLLRRLLPERGVLLGRLRHEPLLPRPMQADARRLHAGREPVHEQLELLHAALPRPRLRRLGLPAGSRLPDDRRLLRQDAGVLRRLAGRAPRREQPVRRLLRHDRPERHAAAERHHDEGRLPLHDGTACNPPGNICGGSGAVNASQNCCDGKKAVCKPDSNGVYRCFGGCPNDDCTIARPATTRTTRPAASSPAPGPRTSASSAISAAAARPCVPDVNGRAALHRRRDLHAEGRRVHRRDRPELLRAEHVPVRLRLVELQVRRSTPPRAPPRAAPARRTRTAAASSAATSARVPSASRASRTPRPARRTASAAPGRATPSTGKCAAACQPGGGTCTADTDCCSGAVCNIPPGTTSGTCGSVQTCAPDTAACNDSTPCCTGTCYTTEWALCTGLVSGCICGE